MEEYRAMNSKDLVIEYLTDNEEGMKNVITWFLNDVMQRETDELAGLGSKREQDRDAPIGTGPSHDL